MTDRRMFQRFNLRLPVRFRNLSDDGEGFAETSDVSAKGMGLWVSRAMPAHTPLEIWLSVPDGSRPFYTRGEVVWTDEQDSNGHRVGVNLTNPDLMRLVNILK